MKNKEIAFMIVLLDLMADKKAPKKISYDNLEWKYDKKINDYYSKENDALLFREYIKECYMDVLNDTFIIFPEENDKWEDIEELNIENDGHNDFIKNEYDTRCSLTKHSKIIAEKVNKLIKNQKYLKERLDKNE